MMQNKEQTHVSERKKEIVNELADLMKKKTVMIVSIKNLPSSQFQDIKKKLRGKAMVRVTKKNLVDFVLEHSKNDALKELIKYVQENCALLFSDEDAFEMSAFLSENKSPTKAKAGQEAVEDIKVEAGPTDLIPGPDISALSSVGLKVKVENGKLAVQEAHVLVKKSEIINQEKASVLAKLNIIPFKIGLEPTAAFYEGKVYKDIKIDKEATLEELKENFSGSLAFSVSLDYVTEDTLPHILGKASAHENALSSLIKEPAEEKKAEQVVETKQKAEPLVRSSKSQTKAEDNKDNDTSEAEPSENKSDSN